MIGIKAQSKLYPKLAPQTEYVVMPPASLSTFAVIIPGPIMARNIKKLLQKTLNLLNIFSIVLKD